MAHELFIEDGKAAFFYVKDRPWHRLGTRLETPPATAAEAMSAAGLDWEVVKAPLYISGVGRLIEVPDRFAIVRKDRLDRADCKPFGTVGRDYQPLQNIEAFEFFDPLLQSGAITFETAGALGRGERIWVLARLRGDLDIGPDRLERYLLLSNRHDGQGSVNIKFTPVRVVCQNTLSAAIGGQGRSFCVRHDGQLHDRLDEARALIGMIHDTYRELAAAFEALRSHRLDRKGVDKYLEEVFPTPAKDAPPAAFARVARDRSAAKYLGEYGRGNDAPDVEGTLWAAYNGVTDYIDHRKTNRIVNDFHESRLKYVWFGHGASTKQRALVAALKRAAPERLERIGLPAWPYRRC